MRIAVSFEGADVDAFDAALDPKINFRPGTDEFAAYYPNCTSLEIDLLSLASAIYTSDLLVKRGPREDIVRNIELHVPVVNYASLTAQKAQLEEILHLLSHDNWTLHFVRIEGAPEGAQNWPASEGVTLLFSGGLDSLAAAVELLEENGNDKVLLASHVTKNPATLTSQKRLYEYLQNKFGPIQRVRLHTGGKKSGEDAFANNDPEITQRTRSFMFLTIAALAARRTGFSRVVAIAENGQMAIHLPLSSGRIGAFSTHTAHPSVVKRVGAFFSQVLDFELIIENPFLYKTKAEVVQNLVENYPDCIPASVSCWKSSRVATGHCGECIPCFIRRIALEYHGHLDKGWDRDIFEEDILALPPEDEGKRNVIELASFSSDFRTSVDAELDINYCELFSEDFERDQAADMYRRFALEAEKVFANYKGLRNLI